MDDDRIAVHDLGAELVTDDLTELDVASLIATVLDTVAADIGIQHQPHNPKNHHHNQQLNQRESLSHFFVHLKLL